MSEREHKRMRSSLDGIDVRREGFPFAVYIASDAGGVPLYVGRTNDVARRLYAHSLASRWWPEVDRVELSFFRTFPEVFNAEREVILELAPRYNTQMFQPLDNPPRTYPKRKPRSRAADPVWYTTGKAARALGVSDSLIRSLVRAGKLKPTEITPGGHCRWDIEDLRRQLRERRESST